MSRCKIKVKKIEMERFLDDFEQGCVGRGQSQEADWISIPEMANMREMVLFIRKHFKNMSPSVCDIWHDGPRMVANVLENYDGEPASQHEIDLWMSGSGINLYSVDYIFTFQKVEEIDDISELITTENI